MATPRETERMERVREFARRIRVESLKMVHAARAAHIGSSLSMVDLLACLYGDVLHVDPERPDLPERDRFILSKGHGAASFYATLALRGFFPMDWLYAYCRDDAPLAGHVTHTHVPGVEVSAGSLGHGLPLACGTALGVRHTAKGTGATRVPRVVCLLSDGECDEGSVWEAALFAPQHRLDNLVVLVDYNKIQSFGATTDILDLEPFAAKWIAFRWTVRQVDGHDPATILPLLDAAPERPGFPTVIIAHTVKGKGVSYMENNLLWHYRPPSDDELRVALAELGEPEGAR